MPKVLAGIEGQKTAGAWKEKPLPRVRNSYNHSAVVIPAFVFFYSIVTIVIRVLMFYFQNVICGDVLWRPWFWNFLMLAIQGAQLPSSAIVLFLCKLWQWKFDWNIILECRMDLPETKEAMFQRRLCDPVKTSSNCCNSPNCHHYSDPEQETVDPALHFVKTDSLAFIGVKSVNRS